MLLHHHHLTHPARRQSAVYWSLGRVLDYLASEEFGEQASAELLLRKALFLLALATGLRASQLHAMVRHPAWMVFAPDGSQVSLTPSPRFLAKNERVERNLPPVVVLAWRTSDGSHALCPVAALRAYLRCTAVTHLTGSLFTRRPEDPYHVRPYPASCVLLLRERTLGVLHEAMILEQCQRPYPSFAIIH